MTYPALWRIPHHLFESFVVLESIKNQPFSHELYTENKYIKQINYTMQYYAFVNHFVLRRCFKINASIKTSQRSDRHVENKRLKTGKALFVIPGCTVENKIVVHTYINCLAIYTRMSMYYENKRTKFISAIVV